jgi:hypothetical protein
LQRRIAPLAPKPGFYDWVFNGETLYGLLAPHYPLFDGTLREEPICFETFSAIVCALVAKGVLAETKNIKTPQSLARSGLR